jgi:hypothetical protein
MTVEDAEPAGTLPGAVLREAVQLHLLRHIGQTEAAYIDVEGWAGVSGEPGPPVDVLIAPPQGERRFAYVASFGCSVRPLKDEPQVAPRRAEFVLAAPQVGEADNDRRLLNFAANTVRQFAKLSHLQPVSVTPGETVAFADDPQPVFEGSALVAFAFMQPRLPAPGFDQMRLQGTQLVEFLAPVPILKEELAFGQSHGPAALHSALMAGGVTEMIDLDRSVVPGARRRRGLLRWLRGMFSGGRARRRG